MTSPGGRIEIRIDPDFTGFNSRLGAGLSSAATSGIGSFVSAAKTAIAAGAVVLGGAAVVAAKSTLNIGVEYQNQLNTLQAVSGATADQMRQVGATAKTLGSDLTLPATSAADAAAVMTELAKANFSVDEAQQAAKGSLQLAAAAQIDGARAAEIQANAINAFSLSAGDAGRVADVLANAANASSAEITDIADALSQAAAVAASAGIPIEDVATSLGILANNGIKGSDAGTLVKSALLALQSPSDAAAGAMETLNLRAYDAQGNFVGLRSIFEQLSAVQGTLTQQQYEAATSTLFGSDAARLAGIAATEGAAGWDAMAASIGRQGAAADVAAAKSRGLGGAIEAFKSQVETVQIDVFERAAPSLERYVRLAAERLPEVAASALDAADRAVAYLGEVGPRIAAQLEARAANVEAAWQKLAQPILDGAADIAPEVLDLVEDVASTLTDLASKAITKVEPLADAVGDLVSSLDKAGGPLDTAGTALEIVGDTAGVVLDVAGPLVELVAGLVSGFSDLPGPIQTAVVALAGLKLATSGILGGGSGGVGAPGLAERLSSPFREFADTVRVQMALADDTVSTSAALRGGIATAISQQVPAVSGAMAEIGGAFQGGKEEAASLTESIGIDADKFQEFMGGFTRAAQTTGRLGMGALRAAGSGVIGMLGGPWGAAFTAGSYALGKITEEMQESEQRVESWKNAMIEGGQAAQKALEDAAADPQYQGSAFNFLGNPLTSDYAEDYQDAEQATRDYYYSLSTLEQAQIDVRRETNDVAFAVEKFGVNSLAARNAAGHLEFAQEKLAQAQRDVAMATADATDRLREQVDESLEAADANLRLSNAQIAVRDAEEQYQAVVADAAATDDDRAGALNGVVQAQLASASAAGQKAAADAVGADDATKAAASTAAQVAELDRLIAAGGPATAQLQALRDGMNVSSSGAIIAAAALDTVTVAATAIPGERAVRVDALTASAEANLVALGFTVEHMPDGSVKITANTAEADAALDALTQTRYATVIASIQTRGSLPDLNGSASGSGRPGLATGGRPGLMGFKVRGPGTGTSDTAGLWALSNNEWVIRARTSQTVGDRFMSAFNIGDWATVAPRIQELAQQQSRAQVAGLAATRAASVAGQAAAGGYVRDQLRAAALSPTVVGGQQIGELAGFVNHGTVNVVDLEQLSASQRRATREALVRHGIRPGTTP